MVKMPAAADKGFTLGLNNRSADSIYIKVAASDKLFAEQKNSLFYLIAQSHGVIYYTSAGKLGNPVFELAVDKRRFPSGIVQFTLFAASGEPINERIAFVQNNDTLKIKMSSSADKYSTRQNVKVDVSAMAGDSQPAIGSFSVSVINEDRAGINEQAESTIFNNLLLTSDLKGNIENPNYYYSDSTQAKADLDVLMLTQGYRRVEWKQILANKNKIDAYQPEKSLIMQGTLKTPSGKPIPNGKIIFAGPARKSFKRYYHRC